MSQNISQENSIFIDDLYLQYLKDPTLVSFEWRKFFEGVDFAGGKVQGKLSQKELDVYHLITDYRDYGHFDAQLNPLNMKRNESLIEPVPSLSKERWEPSAPYTKYLALEHFNLTDQDLESHFQIGMLLDEENSKLKDIIKHLRLSYCQTLSVQCAEAFPDVREWFIHEFEYHNREFVLSPSEKKNLFESLTRTESLEKFIHTRYVGTKRFSVEGCDVLLPMLEALVTRATERNVEEIVIGMAHRGRVNVLANFMGKGLNYIFADFNGPTETSIPIDDFDGDVKYHLGYQSDKQTPNGPLRVTLAFNPSHLEAVNPVVLGITRAAQRRRADTDKRKKVIPVLIHGDAAFAGQGVVAETFQMSQVKGYTVGGTIHIITDNQIGFTTDPMDSRSSHYSSDLAKLLATPVLHVNGDDPEACVLAMDIALRFRHEWGRDIVIRIVGYRRYGHNEGDEPAYTQPLMAEVIKTHPTVREIYSKKLLQENILSEREIHDYYQMQMDEMQKLYDFTKVNIPKIEPFRFEGFWKGLRKADANDFNQKWGTQVSLEVIQKIGLKLSEVPEGFSPHPKLLKLLDVRKNMAQGKEDIDWGMGELLAYGSLIWEGNSVRITGQDCIRGTFTHRHAALFDSKNGEPYYALKHLKPDYEFCVYNSILSEYAVLGFEYGNSIMDPTFLTVWEAQFGDFANGAQIMIDQFITSGESKWQQMCGLVLLLPHGYEGQGPEHSSARLERFLQMAAQNNIQIMNLTTPAQIFHAIRRQIKRPFRKPMIVMSPKSLLRHPRAVSPLYDFTNQIFQEVILENGADPAVVEKLILCSGKIYYELEEEKTKNPHPNTALMRIEQLYPFPGNDILKCIKLFPKVRKLVWVQEEPQNMGAYQFIFFRLSELLVREGIHIGIHYVGRSPRSSPATGSIYRHKMEQVEIVKNSYL